MKSIEALALAIANENSAFEPGSEAFEILNPGLLRPYTMKVGEKVEVNENGYRIFTSFQGGYRALVTNLELKCGGETHARGDNGILSPESTLKELLRTFNLYHFLNVSNILTYLQKALRDRAINETMQLSFFIKG